MAEKDDEKKDVVESPKQRVNRQPESYGAVCLDCFTVQKEEQISSVFQGKNSQGLETVCKACGGPAWIGSYSDCVRRAKQKRGGLN